MMPVGPTATPDGDDSCADVPVPAAAPAAPVAVPTISGKEDPNYKSLKKGKQFIFQGKTYTKTED